MRLPPNNEKQQLRNFIKKEFQKYNAEELRTLSEHILKKIEQSEWFTNAKKIACYHSLPDEVNTVGFIEKWALEKEIYLPVILDDSRMELRRFNSNEQLSYNQYYILEPINGNYCNNNEIELFLVPGVAFDKSLRRLGRGKGYYDSLLAGVKGKKVGLCFDFQLLDSLPYNEYDVAMDAVITSSLLQK